MLSRVRFQNRRSKPIGTGKKSAPSVRLPRLCAPPNMPVRPLASAVATMPCSSQPNGFAGLQDQATPRDGGVARHYNLNTGWGASYPETTGYIIPTFLTLHARFPNADYDSRAGEMLDWLVGIQLESGAFQGGMISHDPIPVTFNTGQILLGLAAGAKHFSSDRYLDATYQAASWLRDNQDSDGCWRSFPTPFAAPARKPTRPT